MAAYTTNLGLTQPAVNSQAEANIWGGELNTGTIQLIDDYTAATLNLSVAGSANVILTSTSGASDQSRRAHYNLSGALTGNITVFWPNGLGRMFSVTNNTTGAYTLTLAVNNGSGSPAGATYVIPQGQTNIIGSDGTNIFVRMTNGTMASQNANAVAITGGTAGGLTITTSTYNGLTISVSTGTLTIANAKTLTCNNNITLSGNDGASLAIGAGGTLGAIAFLGVGLGLNSSGGNLNIATGSVSNNELAGMSSATIKGQTNGGSGAPVDLTPTQALSVLGQGTAGPSYVTLPGGFIMQFGDAGVINGGSTAAVNFAVAFPNAVLSIQVSSAFASTGHSAPQITSPSVNGFTFDNVAGNATTHAYWLAIGY